jgi:uncharacterized protein Yka (UPF0111/DUF47 family)
MGLKADKRLSPEVIAVTQRLEKSIENIDQIVTKLKQKVEVREKQILKCVEEVTDEYLDNYRNPV